ncbi:spermidine synthase [Nocardioides sp. CER19]|uniref:spermine/spermidine synthase domain-containing protein n=1 Tax=Nocardioides sp. CER19 TaxID=3038538 RepID=UPI002449FBD5|nr:spermidine synthase [Nocardioides sp. CER19]MDH2416048.1 spermidine synthase [Nocardioides sp. CER19]
MGLNTATPSARATFWPERVDRTVPRLVLGSALMLFLELALIRWLGANIVHLSYFTNFVLLGSFLGVGVGFLISRRSWSVLPWTPVLLATLVVVVRLVPVSVDRSNADVIFFTSLHTTGPPAWLVLPIVFLLSAAVLAGPGEAVGRCFGRLHSLNAYRWDLVGSLIGITLFAVLSFAWAPSYVWGTIVAVAFVVLIDGKARILAALAGVVMIAALVIESTAPNVSWSPYYKITTQKVHNDQYGTRTYISVNGVPHQSMSSARWKLTRASQIYGAPYARRGDAPLRNVLVVGAGSGSDVAIALSKGAQHVDAVDIDPRIVQIGVQGNPDRAYQDPRVTRHINDGRAFLEGTDQKYDLILFALPDSLSLVSGGSQIRLESFLFTKEALTLARDHLSDDGVFSMYNYYRQPWLIDRLGGTAKEAFGHAPCIDLFGGATGVISAARNAANQRCGSDNHELAASYVTPARDDRPFLYYRGGMIPMLYIWALGGIIVVSLIAVRLLGGPFRSMRPYADLFFMGAAFLLLETKNIATFALLFGTTWLVNALVFGGVLLVVLAAVETTRHLRTPPLPVVYALIAVALAIAYVVKPEWLLGFPFWPRLILATVLAFLPIYLANIAFAKRFAESADSQSAFAVNLIGAMIGGCLEYGALLTGYRNLLVVVGLLYLAAFLLKPKAVAPSVLTAR